MDVLRATGDEACDHILMLFLSYIGLLRFFFFFANLLLIIFLTVVKHRRAIYMKIVNSVSITLLLHLANHSFSAFVSVIHVLFIW